MSNRYKTIEITLQLGLQEKTIKLQNQKFTLKNQTAFYQLHTQERVKNY